jgi:hypothetical protein
MQHHKNYEQLYQLWRLSVTVGNWKVALSVSAELDSIRATQPTERK